MDLLAGTSGYAYKEWRGSFYPDDLPAREQLRYYAGRLPAVEINNTFYRMPRREVVASWAEQVPEAFRFALKASRRLTHILRLKEPQEPLRYLHQSSLELGSRLGAVLFQLPPNLRRDLPRLEEFLARLPDGWPAAFEFRHESWLADEVFDVLRRRGAALVCVDDEKHPAPLLPTAPFGYLRLRRGVYEEADLSAWRERVLGQPWERAFVFFKHEQQAPLLALRFLQDA